MPCSVHIVVDAAGQAAANALGVELGQGDGMFSIPAYDGVSRTPTHYGTVLLDFRRDLTEVQAAFEAELTRRGITPTIEKYYSDAPDSSSAMSRLDTDLATEDKTRTRPAEVRR